MGKFCLNLFYKIGLKEYYSMSYESRKEMNRPWMKV